MVFDEDEPEGHAEISIGRRAQNPDRARHSANTVKTSSSAQPRRAAAASRSRVGTTVWPVAKDTEKLIRQLSLISYLMAERRPVTATEIRRDVEGYSDMTEDAFARRFYADRAELDSLGIHLTVDKPADGFSEQENYSLAPEAFFLPAVAFSDAELAALQTALEPARRRVRLRRAAAPRAPAAHLGAPEPARLADPAGDRARHHGLGGRRRAVGAAREDRHRDLPPQADRVRVLHDADRHDRAAAASTPTSCCSRAGSSTSSAGRTSAKTCACSGSRASAARSRTPRRPSTTSSGRTTSTRARTPTASRGSSARRRPPRRSGSPTASPGTSSATSAPTARSRTPTTAGAIFRTRYAIARLLLAWAISYEHHVRVLGPPALAEELHRRLDRVAELHRGEPAVSAAAGRPPAPPEAERESAPRSRDATAIRPERFARLVTLASVLIKAGRAGERLRVADVCEQLQVSAQELREDVSVLNVVNFGGGAYVLYAEVHPTGEIEVDPEPYSDTFDRPARLLPDRGARPAGGDRAARRAPVGRAGERQGQAPARARRRSPARACSSPTRARTTRSPAASARRSRTAG